jgi:hypothetical protein
MSLKLFFGVERQFEALQFEQLEKRIRLDESLLV